MENLTTNIGIGFSGAESLLKDGGEIKVYDDTTGNLLVTISKEDVAKYTESSPYKFDTPVKHIRVETTETNKDKRMYVYSIKELDDTYITENLSKDGVEFSGGETQKLMLARALYKDGALLLLDEPTSALDPIAEGELYEKYAYLTKNKTSIFISHRLSSTRFCDNIIYLENGHVIEEGTHDELMKLNGEYKKIFDIQAHYYKEVE